MADEKIAEEDGRWMTAEFRRQRDEWRAEKCAA